MDPECETYYDPATERQKNAIRKLRNFKDKREIIDTFMEENGTDIDSIGKGRASRLLNEIMD